jgi:hypothetical protein
MPIIIVPSTPVGTSSTIQDIVDEARVILQDSAETRFTDADLLNLCNLGLSEAYGIRPDLFFDRYGVTWADYVLADIFPLDARYRTAISNYIVSRAELRESDHVDDSRVVVLAAAFRNAMIAP